MKLGAMPKQPGERLSFSIQYRDSLDEGDEIQQIDSCVVEPAGEMTATPVLVSETRARVWVEGGVDGASYKVTTTVTTAGGERLQDEVTIKVKEV